MNLDYVLPPLVVALAAACLLAITHKRGRRSPASATFRLILACTIMWGGLVYLMRSSPNPEQALFWDKPAGTAVFATFLMYYKFSLEIDRIRPRTLLLNLGYLVLALNIASLPTDLLVTGMGVASYGYAPELGPASSVIIVYGFFMYGAAVRNLVLARRSTRDAEERNRLLYLILAMAFPFVGAALDVLPTIYPLGMFGALCFCIITTIAMVRYHLMDIRIIIRKGLAYVLCTAIVVTSYAAALFVTYWLVARGGELNFWWNSLFIVLCSLAFRPILRMAEAWIDRGFYRERYDYLRALERIGDEMRLSMDLSSIASTLLRTVAAAMRCGKASLLLLDSLGERFTPAAMLGVDPSEPIHFEADSVLVRFLTRHDGVLPRAELEQAPQFHALTGREVQALNEIEVEILMPLVTPEGLRGILALGPKLSEQAYSLEEISTLRVVARQLGALLENARLYVSDKLTGLYNRGYCEEAMGRLDESGELPASIVVADLNGLKLVNDAFGHEEGDKLLRQAARVLRANCPASAVCARWAGDAFVILLPRTSQQAASQLSARIREACAQARTSSIRLSIATGIATKEHTGETLHEIVREAEERMYRNKLRERASSRHDILSSLEQSLRETSHETEEHAERIRYLAVNMGLSLGLPDNQVDELALLASLHDIGKIAIPRYILEKPGRLSPAEWDIVRKHPEIGYRIAMSISYLAPIAEGILAHHERWDGDGYPQGLKGEAVPLNARIMSLVDAFDAMTTERSYRQRFTVEMAAAEIRRCAGSHFDPALAAVLLANLKADGIRARATATPVGSEPKVKELPVESLSAACSA